MVIKRPKRGDRYFNYIGEYCIVKSIYRDIIKLQVTGIRARTEPWSVEDFNKPSNGFYEIPYPVINRTNIARHLLEYQLNMIGKTTADTKKDENWFKKWTITFEEYEFFKKYSIPLIKKVFKISARKAKETFYWFNMQFGLKRE